MSEEHGNGLNLGAFDFTPDWAKRDAGVNVGKIRPERDDGRGGRDSKDGREAPRKPFGDRKPFGERKPFVRRPLFEGRPRPLDVDVKVLPETKALGTVFRKLQGDRHAYKLKDLAHFFLDNPSSVLLKITPRATQAPQAAFFQCKACGFVSTREEDVAEHALTAHLADYYDSKEVEVGPPKGNFNCVARCGLSGVLLGPPNIHEFGGVVREMIRTRYPEMSEDQYRAHIEMVRDADAIERWRAGATKRTLFFAKGTAEQEGSPGLTREQAEGEFRRAILPSLVEQPRRLMVTAEMAMKSPAKPLQWAANDALEAERRNPHGMCFALRGAFHHRKLHFFRANDPRGQEFVSNVEYKPFDVAHAIPELAAAAAFVAEHPCCDKSEFPAEADFEKHLDWLVSTGHVVAFTNGVFSPVEKFPKYGPQWKRRAAKAKAGKPGGEPPVPATPEAEKAEAPAPVAEAAAEPVESNHHASEEPNNETTPVVAE